MDQSTYLQFRNGIRKSAGVALIYTPLIWIFAMLRTSKVFEELSEISFTQALINTSITFGAITLVVGFMAFGFILLDS